MVGEEEEGEEGGVGRRMAVEEEVGEGKSVTGRAEPAWMLRSGIAVVGGKHPAAARGKAEGGGRGGR